MASLAQRSAEPATALMKSTMVLCKSHSTTATHPNMGEASPTFGARTPLADMALWGEDMLHIKRTAQASTPAPSSSTSEQQPQPSTPSAQLC
ncbi:unnamed protein product [Sphagnum balticum]